MKRKKIYFEWQVLAVFCLYCFVMLAAAKHVDFVVCKKLENINAASVRPLIIQAYPTTWGKKEMVLNYILATRKDIQPQDALGIACTIVDYAEQYGVDFKIIAAIYCVESKFDPAAVGKENPQDFGGMQVNVFWNAQKLIEKNIIRCAGDLFQVERGTHAGVDIFKGCIDATSNQYEAIRKYKGNDNIDYLYRVVEAINRFEGV